MKRSSSSKAADDRALLDDIQRDLVARVITAIETDPTDWTRPWAVALGAGWPVNPITRKRYEGGNVLHLLSIAMWRGYESNAWAGFGQWRDNGLSVRKGEKSTVGVHWTPWVRKEDDGFGGERVVARGLTPHTFRVFNVAQVDVIENPKNPHHNPEKAEALLASLKAGVNDHDPIPEAERYFAAIGANIRQHDAVAAYAPAADVILMPPLSAFVSPEDYYATLSHEHIHWTGHKDRLARGSVVDGARSASAEYAAEELVAEIGALFVGARLGLTVHPRRDANHVAYLAHWLQAMREKPSVLWQAAGAASKAVTYLSERADGVAAEAELAEVNA